VTPDGGRARAPKVTGRAITRRNLVRWWRRHHGGERGAPALRVIVTEVRAGYRYNHPMRRLALLTAGVLVATFATAPAQPLDSAALRQALVAALKPALPFPAAHADGTPEAGGADPVWTVRWSETDEPHVDVLANPLNDANRQRALAAEQAIQNAAMQSQRRSQADYEQALTDFQRTGRTSEIREISLRDDGVAGERYDAESQLTVSAEIVDAPRRFTVSSGVRPEVVSGFTAASSTVRLPANTYVEADAGGVPGSAHYCPEQAWVFVGGLIPSVGPGAHVPAFDISVSMSGGAGGRGVVVWIRGNARLVEQVLTRAVWAGLGARLGD